VKVIADARGHRRLWYEAAEIEQITSDALEAAGLWPERETSAIDVERLLEVHLGADVDYAGDLDRSVLGYTVFETPPLVVVNRKLTDMAHDPTASLGLLGRWRATLAHEAAHILLHARLYAPGEASSKQTSVRCLRTEIHAGPQARDWREVQANMGMAALLMPRRLFLDQARCVLDARGPVFPPLDPNGLDGRWLTEELAERFRVSRQATRLRLVSFGLVGEQTHD
jgi:IrrE N-terminal-like domain